MQKIATSCLLFAAVGCTPSAPLVEEAPLSTAVLMGGYAASFDVVHGRASRGDDCVHDLSRLNDCGEYRRLSSVILSIDWAPDGLMLPADAPLFTDYLVDQQDIQPPQFGTGYLLLKRWIGFEEEPVAIACGDADVQAGTWHYYGWVAALDENVAAEEHQAIREAVQRGTLQRVNESVVLTLPGCGTQTEEEASE